MSDAEPSTPAQEPRFFEPACAIFRRFLKRQGLKFTPERAMILDAVMRKQGLFEADELLYDMRQAGQRVSKATVYRTLKHLLEAKIVSEVLIDAKQAHYELSFGKPDRGHLICVDTQRVVEFHHPQVQALCEQICAEHGFEMISHRLIVYGVSPEGRQQEPD